MNLSEIVEVEEAGQRRANHLLKEGFRLLGVETRVFESNRRKTAPGQAETYIRRDWSYAIGRTADHPAFPLNAGSYSGWRRLIAEALMTDGDHHKQWYLEQLYVQMGGDLESLADREKGSAP